MALGDAAYKENIVGIRLSITAMVVISFLVGFCVEREQPVLAGVLVAALAITYLCFWRFAGLEIGRQGLLPAQTLAYSLYAFTIAMVFGIPWAFTYQVQAYTQWPVIWQFSGIIMAILLAGSMLLVGAGTASLFGTLICLLKGFSCLIWPLGETPPHSTWMSFIAAATMIPLGFMKYRFEQCSLALVPLVTANAIRGGADFGKHASVPLWMLLAMVFAYLQVLWMRRKRVLPASLQGCKFVTLDYFRQLVAKGEGIRRCQDLPPEAFGDPHKAKYLIVVSHRWMDRFTCDQATPDCPAGLRLHLLVEKLNSIFSAGGTGLRRGKSWLAKLKKLRYTMTGGSDVVIFLDFMSLPQEGKTEDGSFVPRTPEEMAIFQQCLPSMGVLYSMFPVLVCSEVTNGCPPYLDSGWCFSESATAWLGQQLASIPSNSELREWYDQTMPRLDDLHVARNKLDDILATKQFLFEMDRDIARTMIGGFVLKRRLICSLQNRSSNELEKVLAEIAEGGFVSLVDQPVDPALNTPLHHAVFLNFREGVRLLMEAGADKSLVNIYGDSPVQWCMLPRTRAAARLCRSLETRVDRPMQIEQDTFTKLASRYTLSGDSIMSCGASTRSLVESSMASRQVTHSQEALAYDFAQLAGEVASPSFLAADKLGSDCSFNIVSLDDMWEDCEASVEAKSSSN